MKLAPLFIPVVLIPACSVYGEDLLNQDGRSDGGVLDGNEGGDAGSGNSGGAPPSGGAATGGGTDSGGSASGGDASGGAASGGTGGSAPVCKGAFEGVGTTELIDDFDNSTPQSTGSFPGTWSSYGNATGLTPSQSTSWAYDQDECFASGDTSLHVEGSGYTQWSHFLLDFESEFDATGYDGIVFWAWSSGDLANSVRFSVRNQGQEQPQSTYRSLARSGWRQYTLPFPGGVTRDRVTEFKLIIDAAETFDFWIDDLSFYTAAP